MNQPFMILSHHRSGSNFLHDLIQTHPQCECISEPFSMHTNVFREIDLIPWYAHDFDGSILHPFLKTYPGTREFLHELKQFLVKPYPFHARGIKETMLFEKLAWLKKFIPELKIIFLVRDPRAVIHSIIRLNMFILWDYNKKIPYYIQHYYPEKVYLETPLHLCTWSWKIRYGLACTYLDLFEHIVIRLEDIILNPEETLPSIMEFLNHEVDDHQWVFFDKSHRQTRGKAFSTYRSTKDILNGKNRLSHEDRHYIESHLREEMVRLSYV